jgi:hypothetical protein
MVSYTCSQYSQFYIRASCRAPDIVKCIHIQNIYKFCICVLYQKSRERSIDISTGYWLDGQSSISGSVNTVFSSPQRPDGRWGPPNQYCRLFPWRKSDRDVKLTTHLHLVPRSRTLELHLYSPIRLHAILLN